MSERAIEFVSYVKGAKYEGVAADDLNSSDVIVTTFGEDVVKRITRFKHTLAIWTACGTRVSCHPRHVILRRIFHDESGKE